MRPPTRERDARIAAGFWLSGVVRHPEKLDPALNPRAVRRDGLWGDADAPPAPTRHRQLTGQGNLQAMASIAGLMAEAVSLEAGEQQQHRLLAQQQALAVRPAYQARY
jgi:hypothetical protein